jgi:chlorobactene glucosyltransferase
VRCQYSDAKLEEIRSTREGAWLIGIAGLNLLVTGATLLSGRLLEGAPLVPCDERAGGEVTVIVPARNEARNIRRSVGSLLEAAARYGRARVLVVDDGSTDDTPLLLRELQREHPAGDRLEVLRLDEALPPGWMGKPRACWAGAQSEAARGAGWLLFVDADTEAAPDLIGRLVGGAAQDEADLYSIFPHQELGGVAERLIMPHLFYAIGVGFNWRAVNDPRNETAIANGQCILVRREVYDATGGHAAVRDAIAEDKDLAVLIKSEGYRLFLADGRELMKTRMYTSLTELWEGWSKNAYLGLGDRAWLLLVAVFFGVAGVVAPFVAFPLALRARRWSEAAWWGLTLATVLHNRDRAMRELHVPRWYALTVPIGAILCCGIALTAWFRVVSGMGVTWKGRRYAGRESRTSPG